MLICDEYRRIAHVSDTIWGGQPHPLYRSDIGVSSQPYSDNLTSLSLKAPGKLGLEILSAHTPDDALVSLGFSVSTRKSTITFSTGEFGADPTGVGNNDIPLRRALAAVAALPGHIELIIPNVGGCEGASTYRFEQGVPTFYMEKDFTMTWEQGAKFKNSPNSITPLLVIRGGSVFAPGPYRHRYNNPQADISHGNYGFGPPNQPSFCSPQFVRECYTQESQIYGGAGWWYGSGIGGDSAWEPIGVTYFEDRSGYYEGLNDCAHYCGGANEQSPSDDGFESKIIDPKYVNCAVGATIKREGNLLTVVNPTVSQCYVGVCTLGVGAGQQTDAGQRLIVQGGFISKTTTPLRVHGQTLFSANGAIIEDFGRNPGGTLFNSPAGRCAIYLGGTQRGVINGVTIRMRDWTEEEHIGIYTCNTVDASGTVWQGGYNSGSGNFFDNVSRPLYEGPTTLPNHFSGNHVHGAVSFPNMREGSVFSYQQAGNSKTFHQIGDGSNQGVRFETLIAPS